MIVEAETNSVPEQKTRHSNKTLWIMIIVFGLPYVAALYVYLNRDELSIGTQTNYGTVISPVRPLNNDVLTLLDGSSMSFADAGINGKWLLLTVSSARCEKVCMDNMYKMRQIRTAIGEESDRLQRLFLLTDNNEMDALAAKLEDYTCMHTQLNDNECLRIIQYNSTTSNAIFNILKMDGHDVAEGIYMVDPLSQYMMFYPPDANASKMLKDIQRLLKISRIG